MRRKITLVCEEENGSHTWIISHSVDAPSIRIEESIGTPSTWKVVAKGPAPKGSGLMDLDICQEFHDFPSAFAVAEYIADQLMSNAK